LVGVYRIIGTDRHGSRSQPKLEETMNIKKPTYYETFDDLPEWMRDRQEAHKTQRLYAWRVAHEALELSKSVNAQFLNSANNNEPMFFYWDQIKEVINAFSRLCEHSQAVHLIEKNLREIHESQRDGNPF